ncbi:MAG: hypothetical protein AAGE59_25905 [Cyanobacteria bacterium P01_F01_bin.86]
MFSLRHLAKYLLAAAALGYLSANTLSAEAEFVQTHSAYQQSRGEHLTNQELSSDKVIAYRGTGRYSERGDKTTAHRGSGRIDDGTTDTNDVAYRGSGRIAPDSLQMPAHV